jgi:hypothetical protein
MSLNLLEFVIYLDMSKAFDKVSHTKLLHRLREFGFRGNILNWFSSYLSNRRQQTTVHGATSRPLAVTSGVPQGSILGPLLFLCTKTTSPTPWTINYRHLFRWYEDLQNHKLHIDASSLQVDLTNFEVCSSNVNLELHAEKFKILRITQKQKKIEHP